MQKLIAAIALTVLSTISLILLLFLNSRIPNPALITILQVLSFGIGIVGVSLGLAALIYSTPDPTPDQINIFINAMIGSAVTMLAICQISDRPKQN